MSEQPNSLTGAKLSLLDRVHSTVSLGTPTPNFLISQKEYLALKDELSSLRELLAAAENEVSVLRQYGNKDCTAMADAAIAASQKDKTA